MKNLIKIKGDASIRNFYRKKNNRNTSIIVVAKKEKFKNLLVYDAINKVLNKNKILAPSLYKENYKKNYIEIQDFGNETIFTKLNKKKINKFKYFKKIINLLNKVQAIRNRKIKNFKNKDYTIPKYDKKILINEANLFCDWYVKKNFSEFTNDKFKKEFKKIIKRLANNLKLKNNFFVHRDFHVSNLMVVNNQIGLIDSQDALIGNRAYDLASLIDDVRFKTSKSFKKKVFNFYVKRQKKLDLKKFKNDFEILSILRNLKVIGIFTRLALRDGKKNYLKMIPYTWKLIKTRINENEKFQDLKKLLKKNLKIKLNEN
ncbi:phosphotransferase [Pelagibacterales bacterium SAG-MED39]|nr:phosphotransferase [Pelagibacterales bacterium SAG-MED39]